MKQGYSQSVQPTNQILLRQDACPARLRPGRLLCCGCSTSAIRRWRLARFTGLTDRRWQPPSPLPPVVDVTTGQRLLADHTEALWGPMPREREVRIMVTMPSRAADDYALVHPLLAQGMDCMRINCAHDAAAAWARMIEYLRRAERALGRSCRVVMDLAGPKLRTGPLEPGPAVIRVCPRRDCYGRVIAPARVWFTETDAPHPPPSPADACLQVPATWLARLRVGESVKLTDARAAKRTFSVVDVTDHGCWAEAIKPAYLVPGTILRHGRGAAAGADEEAAAGGVLPGETAIVLKPGDLLILTRDLLRRMQTHQAKKRAMLSALRLAHMLPTETGPVADQGHCAGEEMAESSAI